MAAKPNKAKKQELLEAIALKRVAVDQGVGRLQGSVQETSDGVKAQAGAAKAKVLAKADEAKSKVQAAGELARNISPSSKKLGDFGKGVAKVSQKTLAQKKKVQKLSGKMAAIKLPLQDKVPSGSELPGKSLSLANRVSEQIKNVPRKPALMGLGALFVIGALMAGKKQKIKKRKKKQALAQVKESKQVARYGVGVLILKWLLSASQPAIKHLITKKVKKNLIG